MHPLLLALNLLLWGLLIVYSLRLVPRLARLWRWWAVLALLVASVTVSGISYTHSVRRQTQQRVEKWYHAGIDELKRGNLDEARRSFERALSADPAHADARRQLDALDDTRTAQPREQSRAATVDPSAASVPTAPAPESPANAPGPGNSPPEPPGAPPVPHKPSPFEITHYALDLNLDPEKHSLVATAVIRVRSRGGPLPELDFSLNPEFKPSSVRVNGATAPFRHTNDNLEVSPSQPLSGGEEHVVQVSYQREGGALIEASGDLISPRGTYLRSESRWYPATGELDFRSPVRVRATVPRGYSVVSVGGLRDISKSGSEATFHWETERLASMVSLTAAKYVLKSVTLPPSPAGVSPARPALKITCYTFPEHADRAPEFLAEASAIVRFFEKRFGAYPYEKLAIAEIPLFPGGYGTTSFVMLIDQSFAEAKVDREFLAHEIAHQWWGNSVFPQGLGAAWLTEGFANYSAWLYLSARGGNPRLLSKRVARGVRSYLKEAAARGDQPIYETDPYRSVGAWQEILYEKGAVILHMLRREVGDETFFRLLRRFADRYRFGKATIADFRRLAESEHGKPLDWFFDQWLGRKGGMALRYSFETVPDSPARNQAVLRIRQQGPPYRARLKVRLDVENRVSTHEIRITGAAHEFRFPVKGKLTSVALDPDGEVLMARPRWEVPETARR